VDFKDDEFSLNIILKQNKLSTWSKMTILDLGLNLEVYFTIKNLKSRIALILPGDVWCIEEPRYNRLITFISLSWSDLSQWTLFSH